ncbi:tetratricopeptide repeat protein [Cellulophaga sp. HaHa_2_95]|uniref:tetratricopeptide repeat protein n=1 Tax=Cellulophaga sp. HaHa_2_95 TaxID=2745558 RepID=UPI001C4E7E81|nr:tetratricopeptide repeat protein [Cellulophaga sp. HaHa_2_95]QXP54691.1 tetratricopeptide repeat protein [Cellulophaga sp. HaHa_2_95]
MKVFIMVLTTFCFAFTYGQIERKVDSLEKALKGEKSLISKVETLEALYVILRYNNPETSLKFSLQAYEIASTLKDKKKQLNAVYQSAISYRALNQLGAAVSYHETAMKLSTELKEEVFYAKSLLELADINRLDAKKKEALEMLNEAKVIFVNNNETELVNVCLGNIASVYLSNGQFKLSQQLYMQALNNIDSLHTDPLTKADIVARLGEIQYNTENYEASIPYYYQALEVYIAVDDNIWQSNMYLQIGTSLAALQDYEKALEYFFKSLKIAKNFGLTSNEAMVYTNIGSTYREMKNLEASEAYLEESLHFHEKEGLAYNHIAVLLELGRLHMDLNNPEKALCFLDEAIDKSTPSMRLDYLMEGYKLRSTAYDMLKSPHRALSDLKAHQKFKDSIFNHTKMQQIEELKTIYETENKQTLLALNKEEIENLLHKSKVDTLTKSLYAGGMLSGLSLSILLFFIFRQRLKKNKSNQRKLDELYKKEIEYKQKELASLTVHLAQKNTFTQDLIEDLKELKDNPDKFKLQFRRILMLLKKQNSDDKDWELFKTYFADVHNDFDDKLRAIYADISEKEIRLAAFLRMNLSTKEIAAIFNVLPDSILKSKYRLKKKLNLDKDMDLGSFLNSL